MVFLFKNYLFVMPYCGPFAAALLANIIFLLLYLAFGVVCHGSLDDYFMSNVLTGGYGSQYDVHMYFVNSAYGYFLKPFYLLLPKVGWYFLFELFGTFAAFTTFTYFIIRKLGNKFGVPLALIMLAALTPNFYFQLSFTQCATAYSAAGILLFTIGDAERNKRFLVMGAFFLVAGSIMRWQGFLLGVPFLCVLLGLNYFPRRPICKATIITLCAAIAFLYGLKKYDEYLFSQGDYKYYAEYQGPRAFFGDGAYYDIESTRDELDERGMSSLDFSFARNWIFYDTENLNAEKLKPIIEIANRNLYEPNWVKMPTVFFVAVSRALTQTSSWCWVLFCILLIITPSKKSNLYPWLSLSIVAISIGYLLLVNRVVSHVESGIWLYAVVCGIPFFDKHGLLRNQLVEKHVQTIPYIMIAFAALFAILSISSQSLKTQWKIIETREMNKDWKDFVDFTKKHPNDVFLLSFDRYKELGKVKDKPYRSIEPGSWQNIFPLGYWNMNLPAMQYELAKRGVNNPIKDIVNPNVYVVEEYPYPILLDFYDLHYHEHISLDTIDTFGKIQLLKYHHTRGNQ